MCGSVAIVRLACRSWPWSWRSQSVPLNSHPTRLGTVTQRADVIRCCILRIVLSSFCCADKPTASRKIPGKCLCLLCRCSLNLWYRYVVAAQRELAQTISNLWLLAPRLLYVLDCYSLWLNSFLQPCNCLLVMLQQQPLNDDSNF